MAHSEQRSPARSFLAASRLILLFAAGISAACDEAVLSPDESALLEVAEIRIEPDEATIFMGRTTFLTSVLTGMDGTLLLPGSRVPEITWSTASAGIASVSSAGLVTGTGYGFTEVRAQAGSKQALALLIVQPVTASLQVAEDGTEYQGIVGLGPEDSVVVRILDEAGSGVQGVTIRFVPEPGSGSVTPDLTVSDADGFVRADWIMGTTAGPQELAVVVPLPEEEAFPAASWPLRNPIGRLRGWARPASPSTVSVRPKRITTAVGEWEQFNAEVEDQHGNVLEGAPITWTSLDPVVASVDQSGLALGISEGAAVVEAKMGQLTGNAVLEVQPRDEGLPPPDDDPPPSDDEENPPSGDDPPPSDDDENPPSGDDPPPSDDEENPPFGDDPPPSDEEQNPPSDDDPPPSDDEENPPSDDDPPPSGDEENPPSDDDPPPSDDEKNPPSDDDPPPSDDEKNPPSDDDPPPSDDEKNPPSGDDPPPSDDDEDPPPSPDAPGMVTDLRTTGSTTSTIDLAFTEVDDGTGSPAYYRVRYAASSTNPAWPGDFSMVTEGACANPAEGIQVGATFTCAVPELDSGTSYDFGVIAYRYDGAGFRVFGEPSNAAQGETKPDDSPPPSGAGIWIGPSELAALPTHGPAWDNVKSRADGSCPPFNLSDQDNNNNTCVMAKALVYARTGQAEYRSGVLEALTTLAGMGTYQGTALALGRNLGAYAIAADLIGLPSLDPALDSALRAKLRELLTTPTTPGPANLVVTHELRPNNWGGHTGATRAAVAVYLGDEEELARTAQVFRGFLGDRSSYSGFTFGGPFGSRDHSWECDPERPVGINPKGCTKGGRNFDGIIPDDQRRGGSFDPAEWPPPKENYVWEALQGIVATAVILHRAGYDPFEWEDQAILRAVTWLHEVADYPAEGDDTWQPHVVNHYYGTSFPAPIPSRHGKNVGWTDWTHP